VVLWWWWWRLRLVLLLVLVLVLKRMWMLMWMRLRMLTWMWILVWVQLCLCLWLRLLMLLLYLRRRFRPPRSHPPHHHELRCQWRRWPPAPFRTLRTRLAAILRLIITIRRRLFTQRRTLAVHLMVPCTGSRRFRRTKQRVVVQNLRRKRTMPLIFVPLVCWMHGYRWRCWSHLRDQRLAAFQ
jgi:hypothetical protein